MSASPHIIYVKRCPDCNQQTRMQPPDGNGDCPVCDQLNLLRKQASDPELHPSDRELIRAFLAEKEKALGITS